MGCGGSKHVAAPSEILPDPEAGACITATITAPTKVGECVVYRAASAEDCIAANKWMVLTRDGPALAYARIARAAGKAASTKYAIENFVRTDGAGQTLWSATFGAPPTTKAEVRAPGTAPTMEKPKSLVHATELWSSDDKYTKLAEEASGGKQPAATLLANWTVTHTASIASPSREGLGVPLKLSVLASGGAVARYFKDAKGWKKDVKTFVDVVQFALLNAETGASIPLLGPHGHSFSVPGDAREKAGTNSYGCFCYNAMQAGGLASKHPLIVGTLPEFDPALALLLAYVAHKEIDAKAIKAALKLDFPAAPSDAAPAAAPAVAPPPTTDEIRDALALFDTDADGKLSTAQVSAILTMEAEGATPLSAAQVERLLAKLKLVATGEGVSLDAIAATWAPKKFAF